MVASVDVTLCSFVTNREERGDGLTFPYGRRAKPSLFESVAVQSCFTNNRSLMDDGRCMMDEG